jgi:hypothetical protein
LTGVCRKLYYIEIGGFNRIFGVSPESFTRNWGLGRGYMVKKYFRKKLRIRPILMYMNVIFMIGRDVDSVQDQQGLGVTSDFAINICYKVWVVKYFYNN